MKKVCLFVVIILMVFCSYSVLISKSSADSIFQFPLKGYTRSGSETGGGWFCPHRNVGYGTTAHLAQDCISSSKNYNVYPVYQGTVEVVNTEMKYGAGRYIIIKHDFNGTVVWSEYQHLADDIRVKQGDWVDKDTVIGIYGTSGQGGDGKFARHLHYEIFTGKCNPWIANAITSYTLNHATLDVIKVNGTSYYNPDAVIRGTLTIPGVNEKPYDAFEFRNVVYPSTYKISTQGWYLSGGTLVSDQQLKSITTAIYRASDMKAISKPRSYNNLSGYSYNIIALDTKDNTDNGVRFSFISEEGDYIWRLEATDAGGRTLRLDMPITASKSVSKTTTSTIESWTMASNPVEIEQLYIVKGNDEDHFLSSLEYEYSGEQIEDYLRVQWGPSGITYRELETAGIYIYWYSSDESVVKVGPPEVDHLTTLGHGYGGTIWIKKPGSVTLEARASKNGTVFLRESIDVVVVNTTPTITLDSPVSLTLGGTLPMSAWTNQNCGLVWSSDNTDIAYIGQDAYVHGVGIGTAVISAALENDPSVVGQCVVTVNAPANNQTSLLTSDSYSHIAIGEFDDTRAGIYQLDVMDTAFYDLYSAGSDDTYGILFDSNWNVMSKNDDSGEGHNFSINSFLIAGETYYLLVRGFSNGWYTLTTDVYLKHSSLSELNVDMCHGVLFDYPGWNVYNSFTPTETGTYAFYSTGSEDTYGYLLDGNGNIIAQNDDSGYNLNFCIKYDLQANTTYTLRSRLYSSAATTSNTVELWVKKYIPVTEANISSIELLVGESAQLYARINPSDATFKDVQWVSGDYGVCTVDENGYITATNNGFADIDYVSIDNNAISSHAHVAVHSPISMNVTTSFTQEGDMELTINSSGTSQDYVNEFEFQIENPNNMFSFKNGTIQQNGQTLEAEFLGHTQDDQCGVTIIKSLESFNNELPVNCVIKLVYKVDGIVNYLGKTITLNLNNGGEDWPYSGLIQVWENKSGGHTYSAYHQSVTLPATITVNFPSSIGGSCGQNANWSYENETLTISGTGPMTDYTSAQEQPWESFLYKVTRISIENGITSVGSNAFNGGNGVQSISLPNTLKSIGSIAFACCGMYDGGFSSITIPSSVTSIEASAFDACNHLTSVTISASVTNISPTAFSRCEKLTSINVAASNQRFASVNGVLFNKAKTRLIAFPSGKTNSYTVPSSVTAIGSTAFADTKLNDVKLPDTVKTIEDGAFWYSAGLNTVIIPKSVTTIGNDVFSACDNVVVHCFEDSVAHQYALKNSVAFTLLDTPLISPDFVIPTAVKVIADETYRGIAAKRVKLPEGTTKISAYAFADCPNLKQIYIPEGCTYIATTAFNGVTNLTIYGVEGSYAEYIADKRGYDFVAVTK